MLKAIERRRSIRRFEDGAPSRAQIEQVIEAGRCAPTGGNTQMTHFTVICNAEVLAQLRERAVAAFSAMELREDMYRSLQNSIRLSKAGNYTYDYHAPVLVVVSNKRGYPNAMADCACAMENMMLEATAMGLGSCWINQLHWLDEDSGVREVLRRCGVGDDETVCASMALGRAAVHPKAPASTGMPVTWIC